MPFKRAGTKYWQIRVAGIRQSSGTEDKEAAKQLEDRLNHELWLAEKFGKKAPKSWKALCLRWAQEKSGKRTWSDDLRWIEWWGQFYENLADIREITREGVDEILRRERAVTKEPSSANNTTNHIVAYLAAMLNAAARKWQWIEAAPLLMRYPITKGRTRFLTMEEWRTLEAVMPEHLRLPATFALATGLRRGKLFGLQWSQIDMKVRSLTFDGCDNKLGNTIPLNDTAMAVLAAVRKSNRFHLKHVFTLLHGRKVGAEVVYSVAPIITLETAWHSSVAKAGLNPPGTASRDRLVWHSLRHTFASWLAQNGVPEEIRERLGGWASDETVDRYSHLDLESPRKYSTVIDRVLAGEQEVRREA